jgi:hypothetical protein
MGSGAGLFRSGSDCGLLASNRAVQMSVKQQEIRDLSGLLPIPALVFLQPIRFHC